MMLLAEVPFAQRVGALPAFTALSLSERYHRERGRRHERLTEVARQSLLQLTRFLSTGRALIAVADSAFAALELLTALRAHMTVITRLRLDAQLFAPPPPRSRGRAGRPRVKGERLPSLNSRLQDPRTRWRRIRLWPGCAPHRDQLGRGTVVSRRPATAADPLAADPRPQGPLRAAGPALDRSAPRRARDARVLHATLAGRGHVRGSPSASRVRDAAAVVREGDRTHDALILALFSIVTLLAWRSASRY